MTPPQPPSKNFYFASIFSSIERTHSLPDLEGTTKQKLNYYVRQLLKEGFIEKVGYGTWNILRPLEVKTSKKINPQSTPDARTTPPSKKVRGHAFIFRLKLPDIPGWKDKREEVLKKKGIKYDVLPANQGQRIWVQDGKVWLCNSSIVFFFRDSFYSDNARGANSQALATLEERIRKVERLLDCSFEIGGGHVFRVCRWHFSLVNNSLARQYNQERKRLYVRNWKGLWLIIDNSHHLNELETVAPKSALLDNAKVDNWFNGLEELPPQPAFTPQLLLASLATLTKEATVLTENVAALTQKMKEMEEVKK